MPEYVAKGNKWIINEKTIGADARFPEGHPKAGQIDWDFLRDELRIPAEIELVPYDPTQKLNEQGEKIEDALRARVTKEVEEKFEAMLDKRVEEVLAKRVAVAKRAAREAAPKLKKGLGRHIEAASVTETVKPGGEAGNG